MHIVAGVTGNAGGRRFLVALGWMTSATTDLLVIAFQRKFCGAVIEAVLFPTARVMATAAALTERATVMIVGLVTAVTIAARRAKFLAGLMTATALQFAVFAFQWEVGRRVIEGVAIETDDIRLTTLVIGVTLFARQRRVVFELAVKALFCRDIRTDHVVTGNAQLILRLLFEGDMAFGALGFQFSVPLDQLARHQQCFKTDFIAVRAQADTHA